MPCVACKPLEISRVCPVLSGMKTCSQIYSKTYVSSSTPLTTVTWAHSAVLQAPLLSRDEPLVFRSSHASHTKSESDRRAVNYFCQAGHAVTRVH
ncbi:hypothetical protein BC938DRAFT_482029, partial [Jimgerdemannia flammicorona]